MKLGTTVGSTIWDRTDGSPMLLFEHRICSAPRREPTQSETSKACHPYPFYLIKDVQHVDAKLPGCEFPAPRANFMAPCQW